MALSPLGLSDYTICNSIAPGAHGSRARFNDCLPGACLSPVRSPEGAVAASAPSIPARSCPALTREPADVAVCRGESLSGLERRPATSAPTALPVPDQRHDTATRAQIDRELEVVAAGAPAALRAQGDRLGVADALGTDHAPAREGVGLAFQQPGRLALPQEQPDRAAPVPETDGDRPGHVC